MFIDDSLNDCLYEIDCDGALNNGRFSWEQKPARETKPRVYYEWAKHNGDNIDRSGW